MSDSSGSNSVVSQAAVFANCESWHCESTANARNKCYSEQWTVISTSVCECDESQKGLLTQGRKSVDNSFWVVMANRASRQVLQLACQRCYLILLLTFVDKEKFTITCCQKCTFVTIHYVSITAIMRGNILIIYIYLYFRWLVNFISFIHLFQNLHYFWLKTYLGILVF